MTEFKTIGVVGAGVMGAGVAHCVAASGFQVILIDTSESHLARAQKAIGRSLKMSRLLKLNSPVQPDDSILDRITGTTDYLALAKADFLIENVTESWEIKRPVYARIDEICQPQCIFAANTSAIPITRIAAATHRPGFVVGVHWMNPVPQKHTVELIKGYHTTADTMERTKAFLLAVGKNCIVVQDSPGFVSNRVLMLTINEAAFLVQERVASVEDIDGIFKSCFEHRMGPLETADLIGLDTILLSIEVLHQSFNDSKYRPCPLLKQMVDAGFLGRKNGKGFYNY